MYLDQTSEKGEACCRQRLRPSESTWWDSSDTRCQRWAGGSADPNHRPARRRGARASRTPPIFGAIDVIVTNPGGLEARLSGGYTYQPPESFDFNGDWVAYAGPDYGTDMRFTIRNNPLVSVSCGTSGPLTFAPAPSVRNGEFSFLGDDGLAISGTLVSPVNAVGTINVPACPAARWWADKSGEAAV